MPSGTFESKSFKSPSSFLTSFTGTAVASAAIARRKTQIFMTLFLHSVHVAINFWNVFNRRNMCSLLKTFFCNPKSLISRYQLISFLHHSLDRHLTCNDVSKPIKFITKLQSNEAFKLFIFRQEAQWLQKSYLSSIKCVFVCGNLQ